MITVTFAMRDCNDRWTFDTAKFANAQLASAWTTLMKSAYGDNILF